MCNYLNINEKMGGGVSTPKKHVDYIDLVKGFAILWVIWYHTDYYDFVGVQYPNPIFFFASGIFFKTSDFTSFSLRRINRIVIPFFVSLIVCYGFRILLHCWDFKTISGYNWNSLFSFMSINARHDYITPNVPLWFILTLMVIHFMAYPIHNISLYIKLIVAILCIATRDITKDIPTFMMLNNAIYWMGFFILGQVLGKLFIDNIRSLKSRIITALLFVILWICCRYGLEIHQSDISIIRDFDVLLFIFSLMGILSLADGLKFLNFLRFYGTNTLLVLMFHVPILVTLERFLHKMYPGHQPLGGLIISIITALLLVPVISICNRYIPSLVGKSDLIVPKVFHRFLKFKEASN